MSNTTYRVLVEKLGASDAEEFIGNEGEIFYDPTGNVLRLSDGETPGGIVLSSSTNSTTAWERPSDWLAMPTVSETEEKFVGLFAVYDLPDNFLAVNFEGDYTVDWGDGTVENFDSGVTAQHSYDWADIPSNTLTTSGHRQVLVTVTPQSGESLTLMDLTVRYDSLPITSTSWLDIAVSMPNAATGGSLRFCGYQYGINSDGYLKEVERIRIIHSGGMTDFSYGFYYFYSLNLIEILNAPSAEDFTYLFYGCSALTDVTISNVPLVNDVSDIFYDCYSLKNVDISDMSSVTDMSYMLSNRYSLSNVTISGISSVTDMTEIFYSCYSLKTVNISDASSLESANSIFYYCHSLTDLTLSGITSALTDTSNMFRECYSLKTIPLFNTSSVTDMSSMFSYCYSLETIPSLNTSSATNMSEMFYYCYSLETIPPLNTSSANNMSYMFYGCSSLVSVPKFNVSSVTNANDMFFECSSLREGTLDGLSATISYAYSNLSRSAILDIFNELETVVSKTIYINDNYGTTELTSGDRQIATSKGWTVIP